MRQVFLAIFIATFGLLISCAKTDGDILEKTVSQLNSIKTVEFLIITHCSQKSMGLDRIDTALCYFDFTSKDTLIGAKYQIQSNQGLQVFNGIQAFSLYKNENRIIYEDEPQLHDASSSIFMVNSLWSLKKLLPIFLNDSTVIFERQNDTIINGQSNYVFEILIKDKYINIGSVLTENKGSTSKLNLLISKSTYLPTEFKTVFKKGFWKSSFSKYNMKSSKLDSIWNIELLPKQYMRISKHELVETFRNSALVQVGQKAIDWKLPLLGSNDSIQLSTLKGNLILLEFWFPYCGGCVQVVPEINQIYDLYSDKGLQIFGIEMSQSNDKGLEEYCKKQKIKFPTLHTGKNVASKYAINAAPTFFLINNKGVIIYNSLGLKKDELIKLINKELL